jgi:hypothetical protein
MHDIFFLLEKKKEKKRERKESRKPIFKESLKVQLHCFSKNNFRKIY